MKKNTRRCEFFKRLTRDLRPRMAVLGNASERYKRQMNTLKEYIQKNLVITNNEAEELGYSRHNLSELTKIGQLERLRPGLYQLKGKIIDDFVLISSNSNRIIFSHQTALYLHDLSDRTPNVFHISVP